MGIKYVYEIERIIIIRDSFLHFPNRSTPLFPKMDILLKPREQRFMKIDMPFIDKISGLAIFKLLDLKSSCTSSIIVKLSRNIGFHSVTSN